MKGVRIDRSISTSSLFFLQGFHLIYKKIYIFAKIVVCVLWDISVYLRFLLLMFLFRYIGIIKNDKRKIIIANKFYAKRYAKPIFQDYVSYFKKMPGEIRSFIKIYPKTEWITKKKILDLGCGLGRFTKLLVQEGASKAVGLEYQEEKILFAKKHAMNENVNYICGSAMFLPFKDKSFDTVFAYAVFEHIKNTQNALNETARILKPKGVAIIAMDYLTSRGGHHLHPYIHFPWPLCFISEKSLCEYWSKELAKDQAQNLMQYYTHGASIADFQTDNEINLNKITIEEFEKQIERSGMIIELFIPGEYIARYLPFVLKFKKVKNFFVGSPIYILRNN